MFILCRIHLVRCDRDEPPRTDNSSVVMLLTSSSSSSPIYSIVDSGDNGGANGFQDDNDHDQYLDILMSALNITKLPDIAKVSFFNNHKVSFFD